MTSGSGRARRWSAQPNCKLPGAEYRKILDCRWKLTGNNGNYFGILSSPLSGSESNTCSPKLTISPCGMLGDLLSYFYEISTFFFLVWSAGFPVP